MKSNVSFHYFLAASRQTANSKSLEQYPFPRKCVLVLGKEKEGMPVELIDELDACVEIPQFGLTRSLNVHVSAALAIFEHARQHLNQRATECHQ